MASSAIPDRAGDARADAKVVRLRVTDDPEALVAAVEPLRRHLRDGDAVRRERDAELAAAGELFKPVTAAQFDRLAAAADIHRKAEKERHA